MEFHVRSFRPDALGPFAPESTLSELDNPNDRRRPVSVEAPGGLGFSSGAPTGNFDRQGKSNLGSLRSHPLMSRAALAVIVFARRLCSLIVPSGESGVLY